MKQLFTFSVLLAALSQPALAEMTLRFDSWGDIPSCTSGRPGTVGSPAFILSGVPAGTASVEFRLKDRDAPSFNHGGGKVALTGDGAVPFGAFTYKSPCPPSGTHTYEWTATARGTNGKKLDTAKARLDYPQ